ncbi:MAG: leucine-rich repeat protein [Alphaproteobacteria bacterium]|nr:leucine-rich repeat protein [Alphaproteobacteria bacterium]
MKKIVLMLGIVISFICESFAETWNCGPATNGVYSDSVKCTYDEESKTFTISGDGPMGNYSSISKIDGSTAPWYGKDIVHAVIEGNVTTIGDRVFKHARNLQDITGTENIVSVGDVAFHDTSLISIDLPNVQKIGRSAFSAASKLQYAGIPDDVVFGNPNGALDVFAGSLIPNCKTGDCGSCGEKFMQAGVGCVDKCYKDYVPCSGYCCLRTRYTLPEADEATSNDNENTIEWIFE